MLEEATRLVSIVDMFSQNESFEEVATENIKYFLLPAFLGTLTTKICNTDDRMNIVNVAEIYFVDFLKRVKAYGLTDIDVPEIKPERENESVSGKVRTNAELITEMVSVSFIHSFAVTVHLNYDATYVLYCTLLSYCR